MRAIPRPALHARAVLLPALAMVGLVFLSLVTACQKGSQAQTTPPPPGQVGQTVTFSDIDLTVNSVARQDQIGDFFQPASGNLFVTTNVTIKNNRPYQIPYQPYQFTLTAADGTVYQAGVTGGPQPLGSSTLDATKDVRGNINFEVPATATGLTLVYKVPGTTGTVEVQLGDVSTIPTPAPSPTATAVPQATSSLSTSVASPVPPTIPVPPTPGQP